LEPTQLAASISITFQSLSRPSLMDITCGTGVTEGSMTVGPDKDEDNVGGATTLDPPPNSSSREQMEQPYKTELRKLAGEGDVMNLTLMEEGRTIPITKQISRAETTTVYTCHVVVAKGQSSSKLCDLEKKWPDWGLNPRPPWTYTRCSNH
jgi:hypothetical protein